jgi:hypothetical protein
MTLTNEMNMTLTDEMKTSMRLSYALRRVPQASFASLVPHPAFPQPGDIVLARVEKVGKNTRLELPDGRRCTLHEQDLLAVVFGNRYATQQFEGYAHSNGDFCDLLSMGGLCGLVESKHDSVAEPTRLRLLGALADANQRPLRLADFALAPLPTLRMSQPQIIAVCGTSMDAGKTHTVMSLIMGLRRQGSRVTAIKLTGTATGSDRWSMLDAGACVALEFLDGGLPATYLSTVDELLRLYNLLVAHASAQGADSVVVEIADGLLQRETAALLQTARFKTSVDAWVLATSDPLGAVGGVSMLRQWQIEPMAISGRISMSSLCIQEVQVATGVPCLTAKQLQRGEIVTQRLQETHQFYSPMVAPRNDESAA